MTTDTVSTKMRTSAPWIALVSMLFASALKAETYQTAFGFDVELPEQWLMLNRQTLATTYEGEDLNTLNLATSFPDQAAADSIFAGIQEGRYQYFFFRPENQVTFADYIGLRLVPRDTRPPIELASILCFQVERDLAEYLNQAIEMSGCDYDSSENVEFLNYNYSTESSSEISYQTEYYLSDNLVLLLTGARSENSQVEYESSIQQFTDAITEYFSEFPSIISQSNLDYDNGDFEAALEKLNRLAEFGDHQAEYRLGVLYDNGEGVSLDYERAAELYEVSAFKGNALALTNLARLYYLGRGVEQDLERAAELYLAAARNGVQLAQRSYAGMLFRGEGLEQNTEQAINWFLQAARQGDTESGEFLINLFQQEVDAGSTEALRMLAALYLEGAGVGADIGRGLEYLDRAASQGSERAQRLLVMIYTEGRYGVEADPVAAARYSDLLN